MRAIIILWMYFSFSTSIHGQHVVNNSIQLKRAGELRGGMFNEQKVNQFYTDVLFTHNDITIYCDSAFQYVKKENRNVIVAFGHVNITQSNFVIITGDRLTYNGDLKEAEISGNVTVTHGDKIEEHNSLNYKFK